jgi:YycE-like protein
MSETLRVARPTNRLAAIVRMYMEGLELGVLAEFTNHDGFDGVVLGRAGDPYHFEFTSQRGHEVGDAPSKDHLLVFYVPDVREWKRRCEQMISARFRTVPSYNPYWDKEGRTFEDIDGYRIVLQNAPWSHVAVRSREGR